MSQVKSRMGTHRPAPQQSVIGQVLAILCIILFCIPLLGFGVGVGAILTNLRTRGWPRILAWVGSGLSLAVTVLSFTFLGLLWWLVDRVQSENLSPASVPLVEARKGFRTKLVQQVSAKAPAPEPPADVFRIVHFPAPSGSLVAYLTPDPEDGRKHEAIIWITGGDSNSIDDVWTARPASNDQNAAAFREAGMVMMFPSLRGGNDNPGRKEGFLGEVDDVLAARAFLAAQPYIDPARIYLGGHSTGGTLVLLVAECSSQFRSVFSFGPVHSVRGYGSEFLPFDQSNPREVELRSPGPWLGFIQTPTFVFEGTQRPGNIGELTAMSRISTNPSLHFVAVPNADHFSILAPMTRLIAQKIQGDTGPACTLTFTESEVHDLVRN
jgi:hypothetical protein